MYGCRRGVAIRLRGVSRRYESLNRMALGVSVSHILRSPRVNATRAWYKK